MDALITAAAQALSMGQPLAALNRIALRNDAPALALRGIAMAQMGEFARARALLKSAARAFGPTAKSAQARCILAEAEIAVACRDLLWPQRKLPAALHALQQHGDRANAIHAHYLTIHYLLLTGEINRAQRLLAQFDPNTLPPVLRSIHELAVAGIARQQLKARAARAALLRADIAARETGIGTLMTETTNLLLTLDLPVARLLSAGSERPLVLEEIETLAQSDSFIVDGCSLLVRCGSDVVSLATRPILLTLLRALAETWPVAVTRDELVAKAFRLKLSDESQRALDTLLRAQKVQCFGSGRARRWLASAVPGFATTLLLPPSLTTD